MPKLKFTTMEQALSYVSSLPINTVIQEYARMLVEAEAEKIEPIKITEAQFRSLFKIVGMTRDGSAETRGRKKKEN